MARLLTLSSVALLAACGTNTVSVSGDTHDEGSGPDSGFGGGDAGPKV